MTNAERFAIVTPYYLETRETLERCIDSVKGQSVAPDHFVVSDGHPQSWLDGAGVRHLRLDRAHRDFGNTPRGIGALLAVSEGYQAIAFLDADNWYERDHVEQCCTAAHTISNPAADLIVAKRRFVLPDGTITDLIDEPNHIDTNCYWLLEGAFHLIHYWLTMVPQISPLADRVFYRVANENGLVMRHTKSVTVNYVGNYQPIYRAVGRAAPPDAKPAINKRPIFDWILSLDHRQQRLVNKRCGFDVLAWGGELYGASFQQSRNSSFPCGAGQSTPSDVSYRVQARRSDPSVKSQELDGRSNAPGRGSIDMASAFDRALALHRAGQLADAKDMYRRIAKMHPAHFESRHLLGVVCHQLGDHTEALRAIDAAIKINPRQASAHINRGVVLQHLKRLEDALVSYERAIVIEPNDAVSSYNRGNVLKELRRLGEAVASYDRVVALDPGHWGAFYNRGNALRELNRFEAALASYERAIVLKPDHVEACINCGIVLSELKRFDAAIARYDRAIALKPGHVPALINRGIALHESKRLDEALTSFDQAIELQPDMAEAFYCRGNTLSGMMRLDAAVANYDQAIAIRPSYAEAFNNRGDALRRQRRFGEALASCEQAIALEPDHADAYVNRGIALIEMKRLGEALASFDEAIELKPDEPRAFYNRGIVLSQLGMFDAALTSYDLAIARKPDYADAFHNRGIALVKLTRFEEARASQLRTLALAPDHDNAFSDLADCELKLCDWTRRVERSTELRQHVKARKSCINPFTLLGYSDDEALQSLCARNFIRERTIDLPRPAAGAIRRNAKIKIAYISADFRRHAVAHLSAGLYEQHDRSRFEVTGVSLGPNDNSEVRARLDAAFDPFLDVAAKNDEEAARLLRDLKVDIAVDLNGHTEGGRLGILAYRPAPIQVTWLGFPGTTGADFIDYIIADATVLPFAQQPHYTEHIVHLPDTYQVNDRQRPIAPGTPTRQELGLPPRGLVLCCFNNAWKITPPVFDIWMRLLRTIEDSTLWLLEAGEQAEANLRKEAAARGVDPARVVFAGQRPLADHLARHRAADLFLDTLPYNAHTTASDALWSGLPVVTCRGKSFAGRVAASLLDAAGLPDLIADNLAEYEALALRLATDEALRRRLRERLEQGRMNVPLFDTDRFCGHIESAFTTMWELWQRGDGPRSFSVEGAPIHPQFMSRNSHWNS